MYFLTVFVNITMDLNILDVAPILSDTSMCIGFLRGRNLLLSDYICCG